ncbi:MAG: dihydrofolate reductase family protein [Nannocystaceae bacterium]|nr:dihydrofolate reductase family protein [Nannocystaceae bacterium]
MRELAILTFLTLDGVMQAPTSPDEDRSGGFNGGGWAAPHWDVVMAQVQQRAMSVPYDLLLGRTTYEQFAASHRTSSMMNEATKFVATSGSKPLTWDNSVRITGNVAEEVARLKTQAGPLLQVHGSWRLIQTLLAHQLVDEFRLWTFPVIAGPGGKRLFGPDISPTNLTLVDSGVGSSGVTMGIYRRDGAASDA